MLAKHFSQRSAACSMSLLDCAILILLDFNAAFDTVHHKLLIARLEQ